MITETTMLYLYVETPLHAGVGSGLSSIDLPIQRERTTQYPMIQGSGIKGKLRATAEDAVGKNGITKDDVEILFGPDSNRPGRGATPDSNDYAGALIAGDARILLFPVRSLNGVFAYTTSCDVLNRFARDLARKGSDASTILPVPHPPGSNQALVTTNSSVQSNGTLVLEEFSFDTQVAPQVDTIATWLSNNALPGGNTYWVDKLRNSLVILSDEDFRDFALYATEVITRVRIDRQKKTVERGALWTEEHLPTDTLLYVPMYAANARKTTKEGQTQMTSTQVLQKAKEITAKNAYLQLGGDETVGRGLVQVRWDDVPASTKSIETSAGSVE